MTVGIDDILTRIRMADYLSVAQIYLQDNFLLDRPLTSDDIKPRLLGHWGTCHGINVAYAYLKATIPDFEFILGPGHGFPALQANLFLDGALLEHDEKATLDDQGVAYLCHNFSWPYGFPSHSYPGTPGVILEGGELGYSLATAYGSALGRPDKFIACLIGDGELETGTALASLNLNKLVDSQHNATVLPILHLNGYKISAPTISGRKSDRELLQLFRGFGFSPTIISPDLDPASLHEYLLNIQVPTLYSQKSLYNNDSQNPPLLILRTEKGATGPEEFDGEKIAGNYLSHQVPLPKAKTDPDQLKALETWLKSYKFPEIWRTYHNTYPPHTGSDPVETTGKEVSYGLSR